MRPKFRSLPRTLSTVTSSTLVLNMSSTAALISGLVARSATRNTYWRFLSATNVLFSDTTGASTTFISRSAGYFLTAVMRASFQHLLELGDGRLGEQHLVRVHERHRVGMAHRDHLDVRQVARREHQVLVHLVGDDEHLLEAHRFHLLREQLGLRLLDAELVDHAQPVLARELREDRAKAGAIHATVHLLREVLVRRVGEDLASAAPQRARCHAGAGATGALLAPRLLCRMVHRAAIFLRACAAPGVRLESD